MESKIIIGDCLNILPTLPEKLVQCVVTSPPYYGLRDYGCDGQIGLETTPEAYVEKLVAVFREVRRVLRDDGTLWLNLGDSYAGSNQGAGTKNPTPKQASNKGTGYMLTENHVSKLAKIDGLKPKDLIGIPWRVAFALQADGWYLRSEIIWHKPNPMPESVTDRPTKSHEQIFLLTKSARYYYDAEAVKEECSESNIKDFKARKTLDNKGKGAGAYETVRGDLCRSREAYMPEDFKRNRRSVWTITTKPFREAHFATFPPEIPTICIKAGSKIGDTILDPFSGAGTVGMVCEKLDRNFIGIELNPNYIAMAEKRIDDTRLPILDYIKNQ